ncbi:integrase catalytic domain-containing protein [Salinibacter ruber]|uniref:integrase catalytic domain-containing protein n=1 Tax=Salinibacter ruber TaxID=146919 RepID=UPI00244FE1E4|nr:transposase InsO family protein [Salinibacter ruber]
MVLPRQVSKHKPSPIKKILTEASGNLNLPAGRDPGPLEAFSTDFTELSYANGNRKAYLMAVVDVESKYVFGWALALSADRELAVRCWERVRDRMSALGLSLAGSLVHHD